MRIIMNFQKSLLIKKPSRQVVIHLEETTTIPFETAKKMNATKLKVYSYWAYKDHQLMSMIKSDNITFLSW